MAGEPLLEITFTAPVIHWRGPAPFFFAAVPPEHVAAAREAARVASYGWGCVPIEAVVNGVTFATSLFPKDGGYLVPLRAAVRAQAGIDVGDRVRVAMIVRDR